MGVSENSGFSPQIIHLYIGFSMIFTIHFGGKLPLYLEFHPYGVKVISWEKILTIHWLTRRPWRGREVGFSWAERPGQRSVERCEWTQPNRWEMFVRFFSGKKREGAFWPLNLARASCECGTDIYDGLDWNQILHLLIGCIMYHCFPLSCPCFQHYQIDKVTHLSIDQNPSWLGSVEYEIWPTCTTQLY